jgi:hypothetical protein
MGADEFPAHDPAYKENAARAFRAEIAPLCAAEEKLRQAQAETDARIAALRGLRAGYNPLRGLKNAYLRATALPPLLEEREKRAREIGAAQEKIQGAARAVAADICTGAAAARGDAGLRAQLAALEAEMAAAEGELARFIPALERTAALKERVDEVKGECEGAKGMEGFDMVASNMAVSLMSYNRTAGAARSLEALGAELKEYAEALARDLGKRVKDHAPGADLDGLVSTNNLGLTLDFIGHFAGMYTSWKNRRQLQKAIEGLEKTGAELAHIHAGIAAIVAGETARRDAADDRLRAVQEDVLAREVPELEALRGLLRREKRAGNAPGGPRPQP